MVFCKTKYTTDSEIAPDEQKQGKFQFKYQNKVLARLDVK